MLIEVVTVTKNFNEFLLQLDADTQFKMNVLYSLG